MFGFKEDLLCCETFNFARKKCWEKSYNPAFSLSADKSKFYSGFAVSLHEDIRMPSYMVNQIHSQLRIPVPIELGYSLTKKIALSALIRPMFVLKENNFILNISFDIRTSYWFKKLYNGFYISMIPVTLFLNSSIDHFNSFEIGSEIGNGFGITVYKKIFVSFETRVKLYYLNTSLIHGIFDGVVRIGYHF